MELEETINNWYDKKTKLIKKKHLHQVKNYLDDCKADKKQIKFSNDYKFEYYYEEKKFENIRNESIFKLNLMLFCNKIKEYFPSIDIIITFESRTKIDEQIMKKNCGFIHDAYIVIKDSKSEKFYDIALEYFKRESYKKRPVDYDKKIHTQQLVHYYLVYKEKNDNLDEFYNDLLYKMLLLTCCANDDVYVLAKINFFKNNQSDPKKLKTQTETFNKFITYHKEKKFNFEKFFMDLKPINPETNDKFEMDEFIEYLEENYDIIVKPDEKGFCDYKIFSSIIIMSSIKISHRLDVYKELHGEAKEVLCSSIQDMFDFINEANNKSQNIPYFLKNFLLNHIDKYASDETLEKVLYTLMEKYGDHIILKKVLNTLMEKYRNQLPEFI